MLIFAMICRYCHLMLHADAIDAAAAKRCAAFRAMPRAFAAALLPACLAALFSRYYAIADVFAFAAIAFAALRCCFFRRFVIFATLITPLMLMFSFFSHTLRYTFHTLFTLFLYFRCCH